MATANDTRPEIPLIVSSAEKAEEDERSKLKQDGHPGTVDYQRGDNQEQNKSERKVEGQSIPSPRASSSRQGGLEGLRENSGNKTQDTATQEKETTNVFGRTVSTTAIFMETSQVKVVAGHIR